MQKGSGYTLLELILVLGLIAVISAIAAPNIADWRKNATYRSAARQQARGMAISRNREYRLEIDFAADRYQIQEGNLAANTQNSDWTAVSTWVDLPNAIDAIGNKACNKTTGSEYYHFNPNGSANNEFYICITEQGDPQFQIAVRNRTTGIPELRKGVYP